MNDLRIILLVIGVALLAFIYIWETLKQKRDLRSRVENIPGANRKTPRIAAMANTDREGDEEPAYFNLFVHRDKTPPAGQGGGTAPDTQDVEQVSVPVKEQVPAQGEPGQEILVIYITADKQPFFKGPDILKAVAAAEMNYGDMRIFHYQGPDKKHSRRPLFSLANISEPGYFVMEDMPNFTTRGLALFMRLPAEMGGDIAFEFMLEAAQSLAAALGGSLRGSDHQPLDEDAIDRMRAIAGLF